MEAPEAVRHALGGKGAKLHTHELHIRATDNGRYVVKHHLRDRNGNPPTDGQRTEAEHSLNSPEELAAHVAAIAPQMNPAAMPGPTDEEEPGQ